MPQQSINGNVNTGLLRVLDAGLDFDQEKGPVSYMENHDHSTLINRSGGGVKSAGGKHKYH
ncbi:MAG: hypothetical protein QNL62_15700 [Gammaproteobacteria bacterium]|nr:hypothetical protein [Gammaproteobacteria bacterium]